jgi:hypothetical protein
MNPRVAVMAGQGFVPRHPWLSLPKPPAAVVYPRAWEANAPGRAISPLFAPQPMADVSWCAMPPQHPDERESAIKWALRFFGLTRAEDVPRERGGRLRWMSEPIDTVAGAVVCSILAVAGVVLIVVASRPWSSVGAGLAGAGTVTAIRAWSRVRSRRRAAQGPQANSA